MTRTLLPLCIARTLGVSAAGAESADTTAIREKLLTRLPGLSIDLRQPARWRVGDRTHPGDRRA